MTPDDRHIPVLLNEVLGNIGSIKDRLVIDGTFGAGGYSRAFLEQGARVVALDRDPDAIRDGATLLAQYPNHLKLVQTEFSRLDMVSDEKPAAVVLDIGVSSMQIDQAVRGFSFQKDGPLDMRMAQDGISAADIVNHMKVNDLSRLFYILGEERHGGRIARMIGEKRETRPFVTTLDLAHAIETLVGRRPNDHIHPATRVFQALRIYVNHELGELAKALFAAERVLVEGGRLAVVTFHSLEDRMVKRFFASRSGKVSRSRYLPETEITKASFELLFKGAKSAGEEECQRNPRARSAKLRVGIRTHAPAFEMDNDVFGLPDLALVEKG